MNDKKQDILDTLKVIDECIKSNKLEFLATLIVKLQNEYYEVAYVATNGEFQPSWTHTQLLDHITYEGRN